MSMPADRQAIIISPEHLAGSLLNLTPGMSLASAKEVTARRNRFPTRRRPLGHRPRGLARAARVPRPALMAATAPAAVTRAR